MTPFVAELIGTAVLLLLGNGVVANVALNKTYGNSAGLVVIAFAWGLAVFTGVFISADVSGAHLNPAVTVALAVTGDFAWGDVPGYIIAQVIGAAIGTTLVWLMYRPHYEQTDDSGAILATFSTTPAIKDGVSNFLAEMIGTFVLIYGILHIVGATVGSESASLGALDGLPVALLVVVIGMSLGGATGYAINPARDFGPRIMHTILPISNKGDSAWWYAWVPIVAPITGAVLAAFAKMYIG